jgi:membrane associated rhomboid family serine protease
MAYRGGFTFGFGFGLTPWVRNLIILNVGVYLLGGALPPEIAGRLAFTPSQILREPWTIVTYMFVHGGFGHVFWNMLSLFFFGPPLEQRWGSGDFLKYYFICGMGGAALSFLVGYNASIIGASGAVYGVMLAFAMNWPDAPIYIMGVLPIKAKYFVGVLAMMSFFSTFSPRSGDGIAHAAHLGGVVAGLVYLRINRPGGPFTGIKRALNRRRLRVVQPDESRTAVRTSAMPRRRGGEEDKLLDELDRVLEKISTQGMSSLTAQERKLLDEVSRKYRND